jgi:hypothetical protein
MLSPANDREGVMQAAGQLLDEELAERELRKIESRIRGASNAASLREKPKPERPLPDGYYSWAEYLFWLSAAMEAGATLVLQKREVEGLAAVTSAKKEFQAHNPPCGACGALNRWGSLKCWDCGKRFDKAA